MLNEQHLLQALERRVVRKPAPAQKDLAVIVDFGAVQARDIVAVTPIENAVHEFVSCCLADSQ